MVGLQKRSNTDRIIDVALYLFMGLFCLTTLYPFWNLLALSITSSEVALTQINIIPPKISFDAYRKVVQSAELLIGLQNTIIRTFLATVVTLVMTTFAAYVLSKKYYPHRAFWTAVIVFTMYFHGGLIPDYLLVKMLGLFNNMAAVILPFTINTFHMIIMRNFFMSLPDSLEESARIDGANDILILFRIYLPLSMPIIATVTLWTAVWHWNEWFNALVYLPSAKKQVLQNVMRRIVLEGQGMVNDHTLDGEQSINTENLKAAVVMFTTLPIILVYPFAQKYFVKGVMVGSLKG